MYGYVCVRITNGSKHVKQVAELFSEAPQSLFHQLLPDFDRLWRGAGQQVLVLSWSLAGKLRADMVTIFTFLPSTSITLKSFLKYLGSSAGRLNFSGSVPQNENVCLVSFATSLSLSSSVTPAELAFIRMEKRRM